MLLNTNNIKYNILLDESNLSSTRTPFVFIHGFTGRSDDWSFIFDRLPKEIYPIALDLIGHGKSDSPVDGNFYSTESIINQLDSIFNQLTNKKIILAGYSMGGRISLSYSIKHPDKIKALILESTTPGIEEFYEKKERVEFDFLLAEKIKREGVESFIDFWLNTPLFASLKHLKNYSEIIEKRLQNNVVGLSNTLEGFSTGLMPSYWNRLNLLSFPVMLISGELDSKYTGQNSKMVNLFPNAIHEIVNEAGHNVHLEKPNHFSNLVCKFLEKLL
ncbi:MAG: 2-succinyl-6-hydroxy-2,4-cyclohexadiene-1-carboxylate synthase [Ignavibacteria bacterium]|nr:2-succinyl-6-hydroxy-2,4-cyclohexadiene-1-carboxylate synthase [Ignavibacteria bacterium]